MDRVWIDTKDLRPMGPAARRSTRPLWPGVSSKDPSRGPVNGGDSHRCLLYAHTADSHVDTHHTWTMSPCDTATAAVTCPDVYYLHHDCLPEGPRLTPEEPSAVKRSLIERRVRALLDHRRDAHDACAHSDAKIRTARDFPVPRPNLRRPARRLIDLHIPNAV